MPTARIRLLLPEMEVSRRAWGGGGGFGWCEVDYSVNPVGSKSLYKLERVLHDGHEVELELMNRLNPPDAIDEAIGGKFSDYTKNQKAPEEVEKMFRKKLVKPIKGASETDELPNL